MLSSSLSFELFHISLESAVIQDLASSAFGTCEEAGWRFSKGLFGTEDEDEEAGKLSVAQDKMQAVLQIRTWLL